MKWYSILLIATACIFSFAAGAYWGKNVNGDIASTGDEKVICSW